MPPGHHAWLSGMAARLTRLRAVVVALTVVARRRTRLLAGVVGRRVGGRRHPGGQRHRPRRRPRKRGRACRGVGRRGRGRSRGWGRCGRRRWCRGGRRGWCRCGCGLVGRDASTWGRDHRRRLRRVRCLGGRGQRGERGEGGLSAKARRGRRDDRAPRCVSCVRRRMGGNLRRQRSDHDRGRRRVREAEGALGEGCRSKQTRRHVEHADRGRERQRDDRALRPGNPHEFPQSGRQQLLNGLSAGHARVLRP